jgi:SAM-dependent methyltransferase
MQKVDTKNKIANFIAHNFRNFGYGHFGKQKFIFLYWVYHFLPYLGYDYCRLIEWEFILKDLNLEKKEKKNILDVGCVYSFFIHYLSRYGNVFGLDAQPYLWYLPKNIQFVNGDILNTPYPDDYFDCITLVSVIEHIGLGAYGDPVLKDGDLKAMEELKRILRKGGSLFLTTVIADQYTIPQDLIQRIYDENRLALLIKGFIIAKQEYYIFRKKWDKVEKKEAFMQTPQRFGLACLKLKK